MSSLPEWLWPLEDEVAVQEAERLINETHSTLQRMEADMQINSLGQHLTDKTEKLKNIVNRKIQKLEKELMGTSKPIRPETYFRKQDSSSKSDELKVTSKVNHGFKDKHEGPIPQVSKSSPLLQKKMSQIKGNESTAVEVVLTARAKVQEALAVARNVSASLEQHTSGPSVNSKALSRSQTCNVGVFEIKSLNDEKKMQISKPRLEQALLPTISIKGGLERQTIPSIVVAPGEKIVPTNVSVCNIEHSEKKKTMNSHIYFGNRKHKTISPPQEKQQSKTGISSSNTEVDVAIAQLSNQLSQIEELREVNQAQVNHVLRFLLSRVCNNTDTPERLDEEPFTHNKEVNSAQKEPSPVSHSSSSDSSRCPIAYDSLSRFLETYKRAAEQSMLAKKRVSIQRQKIALQQKKDIEILRNGSENHLLIGPLRQTTKSSGKEHATNLHDRFYSSSSSSLNSQEKVNKRIRKGNTSDSALPCGTDLNADEESSPSMLQENPSSITIPSFEQLPPKSLVDISGEDYEDDWEEEIDRKQEQDEAENSPTDPSLETVTEVDAALSSSSHSEKMENQKLHNLLASKPTEPLAKEKKLTTSNTSKQLSSCPENGSPEMVQDINIVAKERVLVNHFEEVTEPESVPVEQQKHVRDSKTCTQNTVGDTVMQSPPEEKPVEMDSASKSKTASDSNKHEDCRRKYHRFKHHRTQARHTDSCSSSDIEPNFHSDIDKSRLWELRLREDLQLQSAVLLNWQLEDRWKQKLKDGFGGQWNNQASQEDNNVDVEMRWRETLHQLDQRLKVVEENEKVSQIANDVSAQSGKELTKSLISNVIKDVAQEEFRKISDKLARVDIKVPTKEQMVQTQECNSKIDLIPDMEVNRPLSTFNANNWNSPLLQNDLISCFPSGQRSASNKMMEDLTAELLAYSRLGVLSNIGYPEQILSKSSSSSTTSSHLQHSSLMVSLSEGELRDSASGSCSCSEGEFCVCGGRRRCSERAPPDGSQTHSHGESFFKDLSLGEILPNEADFTLRDISHGEITGHIIAGNVSSHKHYLEESSESDVDWETKEHSSSRLS